MKYARLIDRQFTPGLLDIGLSLDMAAEQVEITVVSPYAEVFSLENAAFFVYWLSPLGLRGTEAVDVSKNGENLVFVWTPPADSLVEKGVLQMEVQVRQGDEVKWHSLPLKLRITESLEDTAGKTLEIPKYKKVSVEVDMLPSDAEAEGYANHTAEELELALKIPSGKSGVWVSPEVPPEGYNVWINPDGQPSGGGNTGGGIVKETDPTVPDWAKQPKKPTYTAEEVGALPVNTPIPAPYDLPAATTETLGGVKVGEGLEVNEDGVLGVKPEGVYETVRKIEATEEAVIVLDAFETGESLNLDAVKIDCDATKYNGAFTMACKFYKGNNLIWTSAASTSASNQYTCVQITKKRGLWECEQLASGTKYRYGATYRAREINESSAEKVSSITRIEISTVSSSMNNVVFDVQGVRANA